MAARRFPWAYCPGCGRRRERRPGDRGGLCVRCQVRLEMGKATGDQSALAELLVRKAHRFTGWHGFRVAPGAVGGLAVALDRAARELYPGDRAEHEWEWDDGTGRPTGRGRLRLRPVAWPEGSPPALVLGRALAGDG